MGYIDINIDVMPIVKLFLSKSFQTEPFYVCQDNQYGIFLYNCLASLKKSKKHTSLTMNKNKYSETLTLRIAEDTYVRRGHFIHPDKQTGFNRMVLFNMGDIFYHWIDNCLQVQGMTQRNAFLSFREKFGLTEDDISLKTLEKKYERYRLDKYGTTSLKNIPQNFIAATQKKRGGF